jgi:hypothetical protein
MNQYLEVLGLRNKRIIAIAVVSLVLFITLIIVSNLHNKNDVAIIKPNYESVVNYPLLPEIKKAQALLAAQEAGYTISTQVTSTKIALPIKVRKGHKMPKATYKTVTSSTKYLADYNILLAVQNYQQGAGPIEVIKLTNKGAKDPKGFAVDFAKANGVNTEFNISCPDGYVVLALKRVVRSDNGWKEVVYTPYSKLLNQQSLRQAGLNYLRQQLSLGKAELERKKVKSVAAPALVSQTVTDSIALVLALIEHIDPTRFEKGAAVDLLISEVLVVVAANEGQAYAYAVSKAGARGLFQFIAPTYAAITKRYPQAGLEVNFVRGMNNHTNAAKASLLLFDSDLASFYTKYKKANVPESLVVGKYLAAAYNGGSGRALRAIKTHGDDWEDKLRPETVNYLKKFGAVWENLYPTKN